MLEVSSSQNMKVNENLCCVRIFGKGTLKDGPGHGNDLLLIKNLVVRQNRFVHVMSLNDLIFTLKV